MLVRRKPISRYFTVQIPVPHGGEFQLPPQGFGAAIPHVMPHCVVNEPTSLARPGQSVNRLDGGSGEHYVDAFPHENKSHDLPDIAYTRVVYGSAICVLAIRGLLPTPALRLGSRRRQLSRGHRVLKTATGMGAVAKRLVRRESTAAQTDCRAATQAEFISLRIADLKIAFDAN